LNEKVKIKCKIVKILANNNIFVSRKYTILKQSKIDEELTKGSLVYGTVENSIVNGVFVNFPGN